MHAGVCDNAYCSRTEDSVESVCVHTAVVVEYRFEGQSGRHGKEEDSAVGLPAAMPQELSFSTTKTDNVVVVCPPAELD